MMAEACQCGLREQSDIQQILFSKAKHRWLRPDEICEVLRNYEKFQISALSPNIPQSGSLFLFDRKVLKNFRKDGHKWRKKKDGKTLRESHETLQAGSINAMQCYYARGEENANFQRRIYWLLEEKLSHIVFVHYLEITGNRTNINRVRETEAAAPYSLGTGENITMSETESFVPSRFHSNNFAVPSATTVYNNGATPGFQSFVEQQPPIVEATYNRSSDPMLDSNEGKLDDIAGVSEESLTDLDFEYLQGTIGDWTTSTESGEFDALFFSSPSTIGEHLSGNSLQQQEFGGWQHMQEESQPQMHQNLQSTSVVNWEIVDHGNGTDVSSLPSEEETNTSMLGPSLPMVQLFSIVDFSPGWAYAYTETKVLVTGIFLRSLIVIENCKWSCMFGEVEVPAEVITYGVLRCYTPIHVARCVPFYVTCSNGLACSEVKEFEFRNGHVECNGWASEIHCDTGCLRDGSQFMNISSDFRDVTHIGDLHMQSSSRADWKTANNGKMIDVSGNFSKEKTDNLMLGPSLTQSQLFSIVDFSPNWAYAGSEIEVLITGTFLKDPDLIQKWSCMFGEVEVPVEVGADGVLCCHTPKHEAGRVPFYLTSSNRIACSEVREFEFRAIHSDDRNTADDYGATSQVLLLRFGKLLRLNSYVSDSGSSSSGDIPHLSCKINSLLMEGTSERDELTKLGAEDGVQSDKLKEELDQKLLKEKLRMWLLQKVAEDGKGPSVLDEGGQGVLHFAAALGYDWAFEPIIVAGVNVNFRDGNGWTALHWAASRGRERSVASLLAFGADPAAKTDPSPKDPLGRSSYQLASANGHKEVAGYLVEASITCLFESLSLDVQGVAAGLNEVNDFSEVQLFQEKQLGRSGDDKFEISDEQALSLIAVKSYKPEQNHEPMHAAAIRIQSKFRSWKCRNLFLIVRKRIVKIQAHVRGHQVRKNYRTKVWSIGVMDIENGGSEKGHQIHHPAAIDHSATKPFSSSQQPRTRKKDDRLVKRTLRLPAPLMGNTVLPPDDCYTWRKYGQKDILGSRYPRSYYRCVHRHLYGCLAIKHVQRLDDDPRMFEVTYRGEHTCHMSATALSNLPPSTQTQSMVDDAQSALSSFGSWFQFV